MKRSILGMGWLLVVMVMIAGCTRPAGMATPQAMPQLLPTYTPTSPVRQEVSPLPTPLPGQSISPLPLPTKRVDSTPVSAPAQAARAVAWAIADMAERLDIAEDEVMLVQIEAVQWRDGSLGCPQPGMMYAQVITPGYRFVLEAKEKLYEYHSAQESEKAILCQENAAAAPSGATWDGPTPIVLADDQSPVQAAIDDLARQLHVSPDSIAVIGVERAKMSLQNLGCYTQGELPGADPDAFVMGEEITLQVNDVAYIYHAHAWQVVFCGNR